MDEIDEVWEVELFGNFAHWVSEEIYNEIKGYFLDTTLDKGNTGITFKTLNGAEVVMLLSNISNLCFSTRESRIASRERNKKYKEEWQEKKKEPWEE